MKKTIRFFFLACAFLLTSVAGTTAWAHGHAHVGIYFGAPVYWPWYYSEPYYGPTTVITQPAPVYVEQPPVYIEQAPQAAPAPDSSSNGWWYYCNDPDGYYPYIKECPSGWQKVAPRP